MLHRIYSYPDLTATEDELELLEFLLPRNLFDATQARDGPIAEGTPIGILVTFLDITETIEAAGGKVEPNRNCGRGTEEFSGEHRNILQAHEMNCAAWHHNPLPQKQTSDRHPFILVRGPSF